MITFQFINIFNVYAILIFGSFNVQGETEDDHSDVVEDAVEEEVFGGGGGYEQCGRNIRIDEETRFIFKNPHAKNTPGTWPWVVSMGRMIGQPVSSQVDEVSSLVDEVDLRSGLGVWEHRCGGSLVTPSHVITAAHCPRAVVREDMMGPGIIYVRAGDDHLQNVTDDDNVQIVEVASYSVHPEYSRTARYSDIAVLKLAAPVTLTAFCRTICLPSAATPRDRDNHLPLAVTGWGANVFDESGKNLYNAHVQVYSEEYCNLTHIGQHRYKSAVPRGFTEDLFCGGDSVGAEGVCHGDSGSPAVFFKPIQKKYTLKGVVSGGLSCGTLNHPNIYVRISHINILSWIYQQIGRKLGTTTTTTTTTTSTITTTTTTTTSTTTTTTSTTTTTKAPEKLESGKCRTSADCKDPKLPICRLGELPDIGGFNLGDILGYCTEETCKKFCLNSRGCGGECPKCRRFQCR